jgi:hypothetical protein
VAAGIDIVGIAATLGGAYLLTQMLKEGPGPVFGDTGAPATTTTGGSSASQALQNAGVQVPAGADVQQIQTTSPSGQPVTVYTVDYNPWNPQPGQVVYTDPFDAQRMLPGWYIPQIPPSVATALGGQERAMEIFRHLATRVDGNFPQVAYNHQFSIKDWDALRMWTNSAQKPVTAAEAYAIGMTLETPVTANQYYDVIQQTGGWIAGVEVKKGDRTALSGLGRLPRYPEGIYAGVDRRWY